MKTDLESDFFKADNLRNSGKASQAIEAYLAIAQTAKTAQDSFELGRALHGAALAAFQEADKNNQESSYLRDGLIHLHGAAEAFRSIGEEVRLGAVYRDGASAFAKAGLSTPALEYFQKSIAYLESSGEFGELGATYTKIGDFYLNYNDLDAANRYYQKALESLRKDPINGFYLATALLSIASFYLKRKDYLEAYDFAEQSLGWFSADHDGRLFDYRQTQLYGLLSIICSQLSKEKEAAKFSALFERNLRKIDPFPAKNIQLELESLL
jgi:tetratricopeptide (TPR) repeat protein